MPSHTAPLEILEDGVRGAGPDAASTRDLTRGWIAGSATNAQMAAWLMLVRERGLDIDSARALTAELVASGKRLDLTSLAPTGTLGSTGAVGGDALLVAAPLAAALGVRVVVHAGGPVGIVGGLRDRLDAIPGYRVSLTVSELAAGLRADGCVMVHAHSLAPAEGSLATLRDQTATADGTEVAVAGLMARLLAAGGGAIGLELPHGPAGLLRDREAADRAAAVAEAIAAPWERPVVCVPVDAAVPVGRVAGHALEVREAGEVLRGEGPADVRELAVRLAGRLAEAAAVVPGGEGEDRARAALADGGALARAERWVERQGGDPEVWTDPRAVAIAPAAYEVHAPRDGVVTGIDGRVVGEVVRRLGAGRLHPAQSIDHAVGVTIVAAPGDPVVREDPVMLVHCRDAWLGGQATEALRGAFTVGPGGGGPG